MTWPAYIFPVLKNEFKKSPQAFQTLVQILCMSIPKLRSFSCPCPLLLIVLVGIESTSLKKVGWLTMLYCMFPKVPPK